MHERFQLVAGFPAYRVSNLGRLQSRWRKRGLASEIGEEWHDMTPAPSGRYLSTCLCRGGGHRPVTRRIHRLVADAFVPGKPAGKCCVRHLDGNGINNKADNLAWGTYSENEDDKKKHGTWHERISNATLSAASVRQIRKRSQNGEGQKSLARTFGVSRPTITRVVNQTIWRHIK